MVYFPTVQAYNIGMTKRKTNEEFLAQIADRLNEYDVLSEYKTANEKMLFRHKGCGAEFYMKPMHFVYGEGCRKCKYANMNLRSEKDFIAGLSEKYAGWKFDGYTSATSEIWGTCPKCGETKRYASAKQFVVEQAGCRSCGNARRMSDSSIASELDFLGWIFIGREESRETKGGYKWQQIRVKCKKCGIEKVSSLSNLRRFECSVCSGHFDGTSGVEDEIYKWVKSICPDAVQSDRTVLKNMGRNGYELDIYSPSGKVAIEFNGRFWHSVNHIAKAKNMSYAEAKKYHYSKSVECENQGIRLIHIWDYEWEDERKQRVLKNIILGALGALPKRYFARKTSLHHYEVGCPRWQELNGFFAQNNIQGNRGGSHVFTLEDANGRILMAYKFGRPSGGKAKQKYEYEMVRGASAPGVQVIGGASKLWKHAMETLRPKSVVYYIDYNYFDGKSVEKLGGRYVGSQPGVKNYWRKTGEVKNREPARHKEVKEAIERGDVYELWNAGVKTYEFTF